MTVAHALLRAASTLLSTLGVYANSGRREESRRGTQECVRHDATSLAYWCLPALICLLAHWRGFTAWFQSDDFVWLGVGLHRNRLHDYLIAIFAPMAQGTIRPWSDRLFFMAGFHLFGLNAVAFHAIVLATQFANLALVAWIGTRLTGRRAAGFLAAVLWAVSATSAEPLAWVSVYNQVLCAFFLLSAFACLLRYVETGNSRYNLYQWIAFLLGFGAMELNVVYPALAAAYVLLRARKHLRGVWLLFLPSIAYFAIHQAAAPAGRDPAYVLHFTGGMLRTLAKYWTWTVGPIDFWAPMPVPHWLIPAAVGMISLGVLAFAVMRGRGTLFCLAWFVITIAPVLPLRDHMEDYYPFVPAIGLCWLGGWALAEAWRAGTSARVAAVSLAGVYVAIMLPRTVASSDFNYRLADRIRQLVQGVAHVRQQHPHQTILLEGVDTLLFYDAVVDHPFALLGIDKVYLAPGSERHIEAHAELGDVGEFVAPPVAMAEGQIGIYDVRASQFREITPAPELPRRVDVGAPSAATLLGPEWHGLDGNHRWMPRRASLRMAGPQGAGQKLYLRGYYPAEALRQGPVTVTVTVNGLTMGAQPISAAGDFELAYPLPADTVGQPAIQVIVETSRTFRAGTDVRDLGLAFGVFEIR